MLKPIRVLETATAENFFPRGYVLANPDLEKAFGFNETAAREHLTLHGKREMRRQFTPEFLDWNVRPEGKAERFQRFKHCFAAIPPDMQKFPISFGDRFENISAYHSESAFGTADEFAKELTAQPNNLYADIGAGLRDVIFPNCLYVEIYPSLTTDVVIEPSSNLPFKAASLDGIGCFAVLEHVREPWKMAEEIARVVKPGGKIFIDWAFLQPTHGYPSHYYNATREGARALFEDYFEITTLMTGNYEGPDYTIQWILSWFLDSIRDPAIRAKVASKTIGEIAVELPQSDFWRNVLGSLNNESIERLSCGNSLTGIRKRAP